MRFYLFTFYTKSVFRLYHTLTTKRKFHISSFHSIKDTEESVLIIDELDKEKKEDVLHILDSLKGIFELNGLIDERVIQEVILRRLWKYSDYLDGESLEEIAKFSDGNPRDALWIA